MSQKVVICVHFKTKPGKKQEFRDHVIKTIEAMKSEPAFVNTIIHDHLDRQDEIVLYEIWHGTRDNWFKEEMPRPYRRPYEDGLAELIEERRVDWLTPTAEWGSTLLSREP